VPIYRYRCTRCGNVFQEIGNSGEETAQCPCGAKGERLMPSRVSVHFKGNGFYKTDYCEQDCQEEAKSD